MNEAEECLLKHRRNTLHKSFPPSGDIAIISITSKIVIPCLNPSDIGRKNGIILRWLHSFSLWSVGLVTSNYCPRCIDLLNTSSLSKTYLVYSTCLFLWRLRNIFPWNAICYQYNQCNGCLFCGCDMSYDFSGNGHFLLLFSLKKINTDASAGVCTKQTCSLTAGEYDDVGWATSGAPQCFIYNDGMFKTL